MRHSSPIGVHLALSRELDRVAGDVDEGFDVFQVKILELVEIRDQIAAEVHAKRPSMFTIDAFTRQMISAITHRLKSMSKWQ